MRFNIILIVILMLAGSVSATSFSTEECTNDGAASFYFTVDPGEKAYVKDLKMTAASPTGKIIDITKLGSWNTPYDRVSAMPGTSLFSSNEAIFNEKGDYNIKIEYSTETTTEFQEGTINCPGLIFSCAILEAVLDECYNQDGKLIAELTLKGLRPSSLPGAIVLDAKKGISYVFEAEGLYKDMYGDLKRKSSLPKEYKLTHVDRDKYHLEADFGANVKNMGISFAEGLDYEYYHEIRECYLKNPAPLSDYKLCGVKSTSEEIETSTPVDVKPAKDHTAVIIIILIVIAIPIVYLITKKKHKK